MLTFLKGLSATSDTDYKALKENHEALIQVISQLMGAKNSQQAVQLALDSVRAAFKWEYASYWPLDKNRNRLVFGLESGVVNPVFHSVSHQASFGLGEGFSGRCWQAKDVFFVKDLGTMTDCCRREEALKAGVKSGVCIPIIINQEVVATMDFFVCKTIELSKDRESVFREVGRFVSETLRQFKDVEQQTKRADALGESIKELSVFSDRAQDVTSTANQVQQSVNIMASSTKELFISINDISHNAAQTAERSNEASGKSEQALQIVEALGQSSKQIEQVLETIRSIAEQTNLLALNATIEAARAGEAGKGFAVVAGEVKELARQSARSTEDIRTRIDEIQTNTAQVTQAIQEINDLVGGLSSMSQSIAAAVEEQSIMTNQINENTEESAKGMQAINQNLLELNTLATKASQTALSVV
jgi:methyl-accepting chemotaxis protein